jgi:uncharacterized protein YpiB (UPF0302 family)
VEITTSDKRLFLNWLVNHVSFKRREVLWILNYLANHETILKNVHFVENVQATTRGLKVVDIKSTEEPIMLFIEQQTFTDTDQIFHEIRMHWNKPLYMECVFPDSWQVESYLQVLEDNPFAKWNDSIPEEVIQSIEQFFEEEELTSQIAKLNSQIDQALEAGDKDNFIVLTDEVNRLKNLSRMNSISKI